MHDGERRGVLVEGVGGSLMTYCSDVVLSARSRRFATTVATAAVEVAVCSIVSSVGSWLDTRRDGDRRRLDGGPGGSETNGEELGDGAIHHVLHRFHHHRIRRFHHHIHHIISSFAHFNFLWVSC